MAREISLQERAAIYYHITAHCDDWYQLYRIAKGDEALNKLNSDEVRAATVSRWKKSEAIQNALKEIRCILDMEHREIAEQAVEDYKNQPDDAELSEVDFLDRDEFLQYLNRQANRIHDEKIKNDYLKMISDNLRFKDAEKVSENEDEKIKAYLPIQCGECECYKRCAACTFDICPVEV